MIRMKEAWLHEIWRYGLFDHQNLITKEGKTLEIIQRGEPNADGGPDFLNAKIRMDGIEMFGAIELHIHGGEWYRHGHQNDEAYNSSVLHVVLEQEEDVFMKSGEKLATLELKNRIHGRMYAELPQLLSGFYPLPCQVFLPEVPMQDKKEMLKIAGEHRLVLKAKKFGQMADDAGGDMEKAFFNQLFMYMGFKVNAEPMLALAHRIPLKLVAQLCYEPILLEALFLGQAGLLDGATADGYGLSLKREYDFLKLKHGLVPMRRVQWKWLRMRPYNFPEFRLAQLAALFSKSPLLFRNCMEAKSIQELAELLDAEAGCFWTSRYHLRELTSAHSARLGETAKFAMVLNAVVPALYEYGFRNKMQLYLQKAKQFQRELAAESNKITRLYASCGFPNGNGADSQGILGLKAHYCDKKRCIECVIGMRIISK